jgi:hypothetical protein
MSELIDKYIGENKHEQALQECINSEKTYLGIFLGRIFNMPQYKKLLDELERKSKSNYKPLRVKLMCSWTSSENLARIWNKMSKGNYTWNNIRLVFSDPVDYFVIINGVPEDVVYDKKKTIVFQMEPYMERRKDIWGHWADPDEKEFLKVCKHKDGEYNNNEWHLSLPYEHLVKNRVTKNIQYGHILSTVLSGNYRDPGHVKRVDFAKFLDKKGLTLHVYGDNRWDYANYKGPLPYHCKDEGILPYKYTFNAENQSIPYYYTEKLIDGILGECLTFYWGCPNIRELIDPRAYVQLELSNFEADYQIIKKAIEEDWHSQRLPYILEAKNRILNDLQFFPRLEKILREVKV